MNDVLRTIKERASLRNYDSRNISDEHLDAIINSAMLAPTAGNQMLYSILLIRDQETKTILSKSCDNQPFIASAPVIMVFVADHKKWFDYYKLNNVDTFTEENDMLFEAPQESDLLLACQDAVIAAQNAVIAAESLGIGSCYIGDIMERYEFHKKLFNLPEWTFPVCMLCFGYYKEGHKKVHRKRFDRKFVVFEEKYRELSEDEYEEMFSDLDSLYKENNPFNAVNYAQMFYARKTGAPFSKEMARSVRVALKEWDGRILS